MSGRKRGPRGPYKKRRNDISGGRYNIEERPVASPTIPEVGVSEGVANPFEIKRDVSFSGGRGAHLLMVEMLKNRILELSPNDKLASVVIPLTICPDKASAMSMVSAVKHALKNNLATADVTLTIRTLYDAENNYVSTRVWRLS